MSLQRGQFLETYSILGWVHRNEIVEIVTAIAIYNTIR